jgi:hypothetical protein
MATKCYTTAEINRLNGSLVENQDGTVSVFIPNNLGVLAPVILTKQCCSLLNTNYVFDVVNQKCLWSTTPTTDCKITDVFKIALNPQGNDGVILNFGSNDSCVLDVSFDYLFKIKCETLNDLLLGGVNSDYSEVNPELVSQITSLQLLIEEQTVDCEKLQSQINLISLEIENTSYSITCDFSFSKTTTVKPLVNNLISFDKTAFKSTSTLNEDLSSVKSSTRELPSRSARNTTVTYCLQEPQGLTAWENIIGSTNYQTFINGASGGYTCDDLQELINLNTTTISNGEQPLIIECDTPFGTKTQLIDELNVLLGRQKICLSQLNFLNSQLENLQATLNEDLTNSCIRPIDMFESFDITMTVDVLSGSTYSTVYEGTDFFPQIGFGNLYNYLINNQNSGFYVCGGPECSPMYLNLQGFPQSNTNTCQEVADNLIQTLYEQSNLSATTNGIDVFNASLSNSAFTSSWLNYQTTISDENLLSLMANNKIRIGFKINHVCDDICILVDNIKLNKVCTNIDKTNIFVTSSPGFELDRIRDNKKSWLKNTTLVNRDFEILNHKNLNPIRQTNYNVEDDRLVINTKEIDLDVSLASAIVTDVWNYISTNPCILIGDTTCGLDNECLYKSFQDESCFEFMDNEPYVFMDSDYEGKAISGCCDPCQIIGYETVEFFDNQPATSYGTFLTAFTGSSSSSYNILGTAFYNSNLTGKIPYSLTSTILSDADSVVITSDVVVSGNNLWAANGSAANGRLNNCGIWATKGAPDPNEPENEWIGFSKCIEISTSGIYSIGVAADNNARFKINGELFYDADIVSTSTFTYWRVFEVTLSAGTNVIELEGRNESARASFGAEIYQADIATLSAMTTTSELEDVIIFSTKDFRWETNGNIPVVFDLGQNSGYSCPAGYFLNKCGTGVTCSILTTELIPIYQKCCGDNLIEFDNLLTTPLSSITVVEDFEYIISSELINAKNRQTISSYPTLKALYHRYMNSSEYCDTISSAFDYQSMDQFAGLIGNYWVDLIEQVIPSTTIWGSVKIYSNTIFDQQKFKYKSYSSLLCTNPFSGISVSNPINGTDGETENVEIIMTNINLSPNNKTFSTKCNQLHIAQMNHGSEFIGTVNILGNQVNEDKTCDTQDTAINECSLQLSVNIDGVTVTPNVIGAAAPVTYLWSNGQTGPTTTFPSGGTQSLTVTDTNCCTATVEFFVNHLTACYYSLPDTVRWLTLGFDTFGVTGYTYEMSSMVVNDVELITGSAPTYTLTNANLDLVPTPNGDTYSNFVTFLNQSFNTLGLTDYTAQLSLLNNENVTNDKYNGFYIIRPIVDSFNMYISEIGNLDTIYTDLGIGSGPSQAYRTSLCNITVVNGQVIE